MFSMFGRTGAPTKRGPTRGPANNSVALNSSYSTPSVLCAYIMLCESLTKCWWWQHCHCACRVNSVGRYSYIREGPHIFSEQGPAETKSVPAFNHGSPSFDWCPVSVAKYWPIWGGGLGSLNCFQEDMDLRSDEVCFWERTVIGCFLAFV